MTASGLYVGRRSPPVHVAGAPVPRWCCWRSSGAPARHHPVVRPVRLRGAGRRPSPHPSPGTPGGLLWIEPTLVETSDLDIDGVPEAGRHDIEAGKEQPSLEDARHYVGNVTERADELDPPATTTTLHPVPTTTTTLAPPPLRASRPDARPSWACSCWARCSWSAPTCSPPARRQPDPHCTVGPLRHHGGPAPRRGPPGGPTPGAPGRRHAPAAGGAAQRAGLRVHRPPGRGQGPAGGPGRPPVAVDDPGRRRLRGHPDGGARRPQAGALPLHGRLRRPRPAAPAAGPGHRPDHQRQPDLGVVRADQLPARRVRQAGARRVLRRLPDREARAAGHQPGLRADRPPRPKHLGPCSSPGASPWSSWSWRRTSARRCCSSRCSWC